MSSPIIGSQIICGVDSSDIPAKVGVNTALTPPALLTDIPDRALRDLGKVDIADALPTGTNTIGSVKVTDGTLTASVRDTGASDSLNVAIVDAAGAQITSFGGGTEYTVDAIAPAAPVGATFTMERDDQLAALTEVEGDWTQPRATSKGALWVAIPDASGDPITSFGGGTQYADAAVRGTATGTLCMVDDATNIQSMAGDTAGRPVVVGAGTAGAATGGILTVQGVASMTKLLVTPDSVALPANQSTNVAQIAGTTAVTGGVAGLLAVAGAAASGAAKAGNPVQMGGVFNTTQPTVTTGQAVEVQSTARGAQIVATGVEGFAVTATVTATDLDIRNLVAATDIVSAVGTVADDGLTPGNPQMIGGAAKSPDYTDPGNVSAEDDVARCITDLNRRLLVNHAHPFGWHYHENSSSALTDATVRADPGDGFAIFVTDIICSTGAATALNFFFEEGASTVWGPDYLEAVAGRGVAIHLQQHKMVTASTALTITSSAAIAHSFDILGYVAKV